MKKNLIILAAAMTALPAMADITLQFPAEMPDSLSSISTVTVVTYPLTESRLFPDGEKMHQAPIALLNGKVSVPAETVNAVYDFMFQPGSDEVYLEIYAAPKEEITATVTVTPDGTLDYQIEGSELMTDLQSYQNELAPIMEEYKNITSTPNPDMGKIEALQEKYNWTTEQFVKTHLNSPAVPMLIGELDSPEKVVEAYNQMGDKAKNSILAPLGKRTFDKAQKKIAQNALPPLEGNPAPAFTLKNMEGKDVSLSDFKGQWVILDFWGAWCRWCIKGFPELKEAYKEYAGKVEIIGIDCRDSEEAWKAAVAKYELPWVQLYNPEGTNLYELYRIEGFPTKFIVDPEGKIAAVTVGEDPVFFTRLASLVK